MTSSVRRSQIPCVIRLNAGEVAIRSFHNCFCLNARLNGSFHNYEDNCHYLKHVVLFQLSLISELLPSTQ